MIHVSESKHNHQAVKTLNSKHLRPDGGVLATKHLSQNSGNISEVFWDVKPFFDWYVLAEGSKEKVLPSSSVSSSRHSICTHSSRFESSAPPL
jgi:hypothetical protein